MIAVTESPTKLPGGSGLGLSVLNCYGGAVDNIMIRQLLYNFKRDWGTTIDYVQIESSDADDDTGEVTVVRTVFTVPAVRLPQETTRKFVQDIGYLAADKNFTYGGYNDYTTATFLIDRFDLPSNFRAELGGYVNQGGKRWDRMSITNLFDEGYILATKAVEGASPYATLVKRLCDKFELQDTAEVTVD